MKYKFNVDYIHDSFLREHPTMHPNHPDFIKATSHTTIETSYTKEPIPTLEEVKQNIVNAFNQDGCTVLKIEGIAVE